ncbi:hypothetical protein [Methanosarcina sp. 2.H.A.1B.4]|uniref:hypothetical protein n=1 Tax=Methanosarcina sp. 2.H.A.1B.4 TaxID=1483600 RepID=UPI0012DFFC52|nr:hypothetical protein [Methanosarcina sp. 2.H.A.1B.4]
MMYEGFDACSVLRALTEHNGVSRKKRKEEKRKRRRKKKEREEGRKARSKGEKSDGP